MRAIQRLVIRADLPLQYSQGFNPHPILALACPRPVSVATTTDLLALSLRQDVPADDLLTRLNRHCPPGLRFPEAHLLATKRCPRPRRVNYRLAVSPGKADQLRLRLAELSLCDTWPVTRRIPPKHGRARLPWPVKTIDVRPLVDQAELNARTLQITLAGQGDRWARPGEILGLLGLDERADLARLVRTDVQWEE